MIPAHIEDRMIELLADRALGSLTEDDARELDGLLEKYPDLDTSVLDMAAAAAYLAYEKSPLEPLPAHLAARVEEAIAAEGAKTIADPSASAAALARVAELTSDRPAKPGGAAAVSTMPAPAPPQKVPSRAPSVIQAPAPRARAGWLAYSGWAAAAVFFLAGAAIYRDAHPPASPLANERARMMTEADVVKTTFAALKDDAAKEAEGDVVWSTREQRGFMRFKGLAANPHDKWVYQLWIFDASQDARFPIDGGVFDIDATTGDVLVPIVAKIKVTKPTQFAVTVEKPGGVVVSTRERIAMLAKI
jgi:anti-sigma-K factor RskA